MAATVHTVFWLGTVIPHAESPWPSRIGIDFPFTLAGAGGVLANYAFSEHDGTDRDRAAIRWGRYWFLAGMSIYLATLIVQLVSNT
jgi:hypothetical protein